MKQFLLLLAATTFLFAGCKKEDKLPAPTHTGANTVACKVDGNKFYVSGKMSRAITEGVFFGGGGNYWSFIADDANTIIRLGFQVPSSQLPETSIMANKEPIRANISIESARNSWITNTIYTGIVTITHSTTEFASGTFSFNAADLNGNVIHVTEGQFDLKH